MQNRLTISLSPFLWPCISSLPVVQIDRNIYLKSKVTEPISLANFININVLDKKNYTSTIVYYFASYIIEYIIEDNIFWNVDFNIKLITLRSNVLCSLLWLEIFFLIKGILEIFLILLSHHFQFPLLSLILKIILHLVSNRMLISIINPQIVSCTNPIQNPTSLHPRDITRNFLRSRIYSVFR